MAAQRLRFPVLRPVFRPAFGPVGWAMGIAAATLSCQGVTLLDPQADPVAAVDPGPPGPCSVTLIEQSIDSSTSPTVLHVDGNTALRGARLELPAGALPPGTKVRLAVGPQLVGGELTTLAAQSSVLSLCVETNQPTEGALPVFAKPALLVLPYQAALLGGKPVNYLAMAMADGLGKPPRRRGDLLLVDEPNQLAAAEIRSPAIYSIITIGKGAPAADANLSVLFVIDNSGSMTPKQRMLTDLYPTFFDQVTRVNHPDPKVAACVQYNIGVITTDMGSALASFGDNGQLQTQYCHQRGLTSAEAVAACAAADCTAVPALTKRYITRDPMRSAAEQKKQFRCLATVGDLGSGVEQPLESLSQAIQTDPDLKLPGGPRKFFRPHGMNSIVFLTDEGDTSMDTVPIKGTGRSARDEFWSPTLPCDPMDPKQPSCYSDANLGLRCLGVALKCDQPWTTPTKTMLTSCVDRGDKAIGLKPAAKYAGELQRYIQDLDPKNPMDATELDYLFVRGIWPLGQGVTTLEKTISTPFDPLNPPPSPSLGDQAFCYDPASLKAGQPPILGHPQKRLNTFIETLIPTGGGGSPAQGKVGSICVPKDREQILADLADTIVNNPMICPTKLL